MERFMGKIQIVTDSVSDISVENEKKYDINIIIIRNIIFK